MSECATKLTAAHVEELDAMGLNPQRICNLIRLYNTAVPFLALFGVVVPPMPVPSFCNAPAKE
jgi:hypothetical protein